MIEVPEINLKIKNYKFLGMIKVIDKKRILSEIVNVEFKIQTGSYLTFASIHTKVKDLLNTFIKKTELDEIPNVLTKIYFLYNAQKIDTNSQDTLKSYFSAKSLIVINVIYL